MYSICIVFGNLGLKEHLEVSDKILVDQEKLLSYWGYWFINKWIIYYLSINGLLCFLYNSYTCTIMSYKLKNNECSQKLIYRNLRHSKNEEVIIICRI